MEPNFSIALGIYVLLKYYKLVYEQSHQWKNNDGAPETCTTLPFTSMMEYSQMHDSRKNRWYKIGWLKKWRGGNEKKNK